jgi:hypothetical protein
MTDPASIDDALAAGWPIVTVEDVTARPLETRDPRAELRSRYVGQNVVATSMGQARFATITAVSYVSKMITLHVWPEQNQPSHLRGPRPDWFLYRCQACGHIQAKTPAGGELHECCNRLNEGVDARPVHNATNGAIKDWTSMADVIGSSRSDWTRPRESESPSSTQHTHT